MHGASALETTLRAPGPSTASQGQDPGISEVLLPWPALPSFFRHLRTPHTPGQEPQVQQVTGVMTAQRDHTGAAENRLGQAETPGNRDPGECGDRMSENGAEAREQVGAEERSINSALARALCCVAHSSQPALLPFSRHTCPPLLPLHSALSLPAPCSASQAVPRTQRPEPQMMPA